MKKLNYTFWLLLFFSIHLSSQCIIDDLIVEAHDCDNGTFLVDLDFNPIGTSDSFTVVGNGTNYGTFSYSELYLTLGPLDGDCLLYTSPSPRDATLSRMPSSA